MINALEQKIEKVDERVTFVESALGHFIVSSTSALNRLEKEMREFKDEMKVFKDEMKAFKDEMKEFKDEMKVFKDEMEAFKDEMREFKDEMKVFVDEMKAFKDEMKEFKDEMKMFKDEMKDFKDEMKDFKDEMKVFKDEMTEYKNWSKNMIETMNAQWGYLARKMGTLVEDIFYPSSDIVIEKYFNIKVDSITVRKRIRKHGEEYEVDILAASSETRRAFIFEIKSNPDFTEAIGIFKKKLERAYEFLDEIAGYKIYPIYGGLSMQESTIQMLTNEGIFAIIFKGNVLEIVNFDALKEKI